MNLISKSLTILTSAQLLVIFTFAHIFWRYFIFAVWLRRKLIGDNTIDVQLQWLARGPSATIMQYQGYEINGYTFYTNAQDEKSTNQNSGVRIDAIGHDGNKDNYFGVIEKYGSLTMAP